MSNPFYKPNKYRLTRVKKTAHPCPIYIPYLPPAITERKTPPKSSSSIIISLTYCIYLAPDSVLLHPGAKFLGSRYFWTGLPTVVDLPADCLQGKYLEDLRLTCPVVSGASILLSGVCMEGMLTIIQHLNPGSMNGLVRISAIACSKSKIHWAFMLIIG